MASMASGMDSGEAGTGDAANGNAARGPRAPSSGPPASVIAGPTAPTGAVLSAHGVPRGRTSRYVGVSWVPARGKWRARVRQRAASKTGPPGPPLGVGGASEGGGSAAGAGAGDPGAYKGAMDGQPRGGGKKEDAGRHCGYWETEREAAVAVDVRRIQMGLGPTNGSTEAERAHVAKRVTKIGTVMVPNKSSAFRGVSWSKEKMRWKAELKFRKMRKHLGFYDDERDAAAAYDAGCLNNNLPSRNGTTPEEQAAALAKRGGRRRLNVSKYRGVKWDGRAGRGVWVASVTVKNKNQVLGTFNEEIDAARAYDLRFARMGRAPPNKTLTKEERDEVAREVENEDAAASANGNVAAGVPVSQGAAAGEGSVGGAGAGAAAAVSAAPAAASAPAASRSAPRGTTTVVAPPVSAAPARAGAAGLASLVAAASSAVATPNTTTVVAAPVSGSSTLDGTAADNMRSLLALASPLVPPSASVDAEALAVAQRELAESTRLDVAKRAREAEARRSGAELSNGEDDVDGDGSGSPKRRRVRTTG